MWVSVGATGVGLALVTGGALWVDAARETDQTDPEAGVTADFKRSSVDKPPIRFLDVAQPMGLVMRHGPGPRTRNLPEDTGSGCAWGDFDGDGDWDIYFVNYPATAGADPQASGTNRLLRNDGDGFVDVTEAAGVGDPDGFGMGASFADYDDDGDVDLYVTNFGPNRLYRNRGDGTFEELAAAAGVAADAWSTGVAWGDFDRDGWLDLYVCNYVAYEEDEFGGASQLGSESIPFTLNPNSFDPVANRLYRNRGDGSFEDVAELLGVADPAGRSLAATMCDLDGDGWLDLYVNNDVSTNRLFRNPGDGAGSDGAPLVRFEDLSATSGTADPRGSMGLSVGEIGSMSGRPDTLPDLFITHWIAQENALYQSFPLPGGRIEYRDMTRRFRLAEVSIDNVGWGSAFLDLDLDGLLDLAVANGSTLETKQDPLLLKDGPLFLFWNEGRRYVELAQDAGAACAGRYWGRGLALADFDRDGDVDLAVTVNRGQPLLLRNDTETSHESLVVTLRGPAAACFGARIELELDGERQVRWYGADVSFLSMHATEFVFGLGPAQVVERISVSWADGTRTQRSDVAAGRLELRHGE